MLVEDDIELAHLMKDYFTHHHFTVSLIQNGLDAVPAILEQQPDLVILDVMLPGQNGVDVCKQVRQKYRGIILIQTALDDDLDQITGLESGADDYVVKQVNPRLLLSRIHSLFRRVNRQVQAQTNQDSDQTRQCGALTISYSDRSVKINDQILALTTAEFELLALLAASPGKVVSRETIMQELRGYEYDGLDRSIDRRISRLRKKLSEDLAEQTFIKTVHGKGYQLCF
ncbi:MULTISPECIES: winged helix-turn-helix domain-containing protein [unclassified Agarivorans]|uniref:winged helix-turn-helix domain-containing protein n=1 Tax=unclassified Agarivorans TaxID=2636026 RepID=UPI003D7DA3FD